MSDWIIEVVGKLGYIGIFLLTLVENIFPPIPSELIMPLAGYHSAQGRMTLAGAIAAGSAGSMLGTLGWYWLGRQLGEQRLRGFIEKHGRWLAMDVEDIDRSKGWFQRHGVAAVFFCRLMPGIRTFISLPAGFSEMPSWKFLLPSAAGTILWTAGLTYAGNLLGQNHEQVKGLVGIASTVCLAAIGGLYVWRQIQFYRRKRTTARR